MPTNTKALQVAEPVAQIAGKNAVINGGFDIWQRGTSIVIPNSFAYYADRWNNRGAAASITASRQSSGAPLGSQYYIRFTSTAGSSYADLDQIIETANVAPFWGKTVTLSIKMRGNATMAGNSGNSQTIFIDKSSTVDAGVGASWTRIASVSYANSTLPTGTTSSDWVTYSTTVVIPNDGTANTIRIGQEYSGTGAANGSILDMAQVQLELGNTATPFSRAGGTIQGELAACQRYYYRQTENPSWIGNGFCNGTTNVDIQVFMPVIMRTSPTVSFANGTNYFGINFGSSSANTNTTSNIYDASPRSFYGRFASSGLTNGFGAAVKIQNASAYWEASAEL